MTYCKNLIIDIYNFGIKVMKPNTKDREVLFGFLFTFAVLYAIIMTTLVIVSVITGIPVYVSSLGILICMGSVSLFHKGKSWISKHTK